MIPVGFSEAFDSHEQDQVSDSRQIRKRLESADTLSRSPINYYYSHTGMLSTYEPSLK